MAKTTRKRSTGSGGSKRVASLQTLAQAALGRRVPSLRMLAARHVPFARKRRPPARLVPRTHRTISGSDLYWNQANPGAFGNSAPPLEFAAYTTLMDEAIDHAGSDYEIMPVLRSTEQPRPHHTRESSSSSSSSGRQRRVRKRGRPRARGGGRRRGR